jgi:hypothetical protein
VRRELGLEKKVKKNLFPSNKLIPNSPLVFVVKRKRRGGARRSSI